MATVSEEVVRVGDTVAAPFPVLDLATALPVTGATFTVVYARYGAANTVFVPTFAEVGNGEYRCAFTPPAVGVYRALWYCNQTGERWSGTWEVQASSARADEPFAWRAGDTVYAYFPLVDETTNVPITGAVLGVSLNTVYFKDPEGVQLLPPGGFQFYEIGGGEYLVTFTPNKAGAYAGLFRYGAFGPFARLDVQVLAGRTGFGNYLTRYQLVKRCAERLGDLYSGTLTGVTSASQFADTGRWEEDSRFKGGSIYMYTGNARGQNRIVRTFVSSTGTFTVAPAFVTTPNVGDEYLLTRKWRYQEYCDAVDSAVRVMRGQVLVDVVDETLALSTSQWQYPIPEAFNWLARVEFRDPTYPDNWFAIPTAHWAVEYPNAARNSPLVVLTPYAVRRWGSTGQGIRLVGQRYANVLASDADVTEVPSDYVVAQACYQLLQQNSMGPMDPLGRSQLAQVYQQEAQAVLGVMKSALWRAGSRRVRD